MSAGVAGRAGRRPPGKVAELVRALVLAGNPQLLGHERLARSVYRLRFDAPAVPASVVVKRLSPRVARVNHLVAERWLPSAGLEWACPRLYGTLHEPGGSAVWQVYEDLGDNLLDPGVADARDVGGVVELIAEVHARFAAHAVLGECRRHGGELGMGFYTSEVTRAVALLRSIGSRRHGLQPEQRELADRLLGRMERLYAERHERARLLAALGGPPTLLHGDLWTTNVVIVEHADGGEPRLIDWDHAGVGSVSYDLSTFLYRFPPASRPGILGSYREAAARHGRRLPSDADLNVLFETAECARYACCMGEAARYAAARESWAFDELAQIEGWFERLEPVLS